MFILWHETNPLSDKPLQSCGNMDTEDGFESLWCFR